MIGYAIIKIYSYDGLDRDSIFLRYLNLSFYDFYNYLSSLSIGFYCRLYFDIDPLDYDSNDSYIFKVRIDDNAL